MNRRKFHKLLGFGAIGAFAGDALLDAQSTPGISPDMQCGFKEPDPINFEDHAGFVPIFDGKTLKDWDGNPDVWRVEGEAISNGSLP